MGEDTRKHDMIFVSHANPEDNQFALWLSLRLANCGYPVWCDLTKLLGGEYFWEDIEKAIRSRTQKFLFVLSKTSNYKPGALDELNLALTVERRDNLKDFVIPLLIDDLQPKDFNISLQRRIAIPFHQNWASGLKQLLTKFDKDKILKDPRFNPSAVNTWWEANTLTDCAIRTESEDYFSNLFPIKSLPPVIYIHTFQTSYSYALKKNRLHYPYRRNGSYLISFASADNLTQNAPLEGLIINSKLINLQDFLQGISTPLTLKSQDAQNMVTDLVRKSWENLAWSKLPLHKLGKYKKAVYFRNDYIKGNRVKAQLDFVSGRDIVGCRNRRDQYGNIIRTTYWHFALEAKPIIFPYPAFFIIPHVLFSNDGKNIWESDLRNNKARRRYCKDWWNPEWRDRLLGMIDWLGDKQGYMELSLGSEKDVQVSTIPTVFQAPVTYIEPTEKTGPKPEAETDLDIDSPDGEID